jgi:hypothetical protein
MIKDGLAGIFVKDTLPNVTLDSVSFVKILARANVIILALTPWAA